MRRRTRYNGPHLSGKGEGPINDYEVLPGRHPPAKGATLRDAKLAYKSYGALNEEEQRHCLPNLVFRAALGERVVDRRGMALDPDEYFVVVPNMPGNGLSTSPSNTPPPYGKARFPDVAFYDNVSLQKLVTEHFGIERLALVTGWSMGAGQTYQWAVVLPASLGVRQDLIHPLDLLETLSARGSSGFASGWYFQTNL